MMQQFFSLFNAFSQGMLLALLPSLFLNQIKIFRDGKINHSFVYVLQLVALAAHALVVPSFSVITIGIFSAAALSNLYGMILGDQRDETGKISQKVFDFLNFNRILMVACSLATLYTRFLAIPTVGVVSFIGFVVQLSVPISLELIDLFNIKLEADSLFFSFKDIHQQTSLWFITYESLMMRGWRSLLLFGLAVIQNHKNVYDVFIKIKNLSPFISLNNWWHSSLYAYQRKQHPYLDQTMQLFVQTPLESATVVLKPPCEDESPTPILLSFTDQEMGVLKAIGQEKLDNAEGLFEKIAQINTELQQTAFTEQELDNLTRILGDDHQLSVKIKTELNHEILERELEPFRKRPKVILDFVTQVHAKIIPHAIFELRTMTMTPKELERLKAIDQAAYGGQEDLFRKIQAIDHESTDQQQQQGYQKTILTEPEWKTLQNILGEDDSILQKVTPQLSHDNPLYWNLSHFMKIGVKRTLMLANRSGLDSVSRLFLEETKEKFKKFSILEKDATKIEQFHADIELLITQNPTQANSIRAKAHLVLHVFLLNKFINPDYSQGYFAAENPNIEEYKTDLLSESSLAPLGQNEQLCAHHIMPFKPAELSLSLSEKIKTFCTRLPDGSLEKSDLMALADHLQTWPALENFACRSTHSNSALGEVTPQQRLLILMGNILGQLIEPLYQVCALSTDTDHEQDLYQAESYRKLCQLSNEYKSTIGTIDLESATEAKCFPLIIKSFQEYNKSVDPVLMINNALHSWAEQELIASNLELTSVALESFTQKDLSILKRLVTQEHPQDNPLFIKIKRLTHQDCKTEVFKSSEVELIKKLIGKELVLSNRLVDGKKPVPLQIDLNLSKKSLINKIDKKKPVFLKTAGELYDFWRAKQTYGNYFYKKINQGYRFVCAIFEGFFEIEQTHENYLAIRKFFGFSTIVGEFHENSLHFCSNSGVFPFIKNENQEHYKVTPGPFYVGDYSGLSGFDVSLILQSADYGFMKRVIIDEYLKHMREEDGYSFSIHTLEKHFKECLHEHDWASLKWVERDLDYSSYAESIQKLAEILVIIQLMNQGIFLLKPEFLKEIQMKEDQTVKNDAETITEQYGDYIPNHFNFNSKSLIFKATPFAAVYFQRQLTTLRQRP